MFDSLLRRLARLSPREDVPDDVLEVTGFLEGDPITLAAAADGVGVVVCVGCLLGAAVLGSPSVAILAVFGSIAAVAICRGTLLVVAHGRRTRALGEAPDVVGRAVLRVRIAPTTEGAAAFAAEHDGRLGKSLGGHVRRARGTPRSGLDSFAEAWGETFPALRRSVSLVIAAADAPDGKRERTLDRAMDAVLDGTRNRAADAAESIQGPATALYAFGVLLPLALIGVLPAAGAAGIEATLPLVVFVYDLLLPACVLGVTGWLLANRPVAFPPSPIDRSKHEVPEGWLRPILAAFVAGTVASVLTTPLPRWTTPIAVCGTAAGTGLLVRYRPVIAIRAEAQKVESRLPDGLYLVGRRVADGVAVETAVEEAADELDGPAGVAFSEAARRQKQLRMGIEAALAGDHGPFATVPSRRTDAVADLLGIAAWQGPPAGEALVETAEHLEALREIEQRSRRDLGRVTSTLSNTAAGFGPLVGGSTVALARGVETTDAMGGSAPPTAGLGIAVGCYVLLLAVVLTVLSVGLARGIDRPTVGYRSGIALLVATATYLGAFLVVSQISVGL
ncbi:MAG: type II secretion system protein [Natronomonas sp.]